MISNWANTLWMSFKVITVVCQCHYTCISFYWSWYFWNLCTLIEKAWKDDIRFIKCKLWMTFKILIQIPLVDNAQIWYYTLFLSLSLSPLTAQYFSLLCRNASPASCMPFSRCTWAIVWMAKVSLGDAARLCN